MYTQKLICLAIFSVIWYREGCLVQGSQVPCDQAGYFADPDDCSKYHVCEENEAGDFWESIVTCPDDTVWCQMALKCESPSICPCAITGPTTSTSLAEETTTELPITFPRNCFEIQISFKDAQNPENFNSSAPYQIYPFGPFENPVTVRCDFETEGGGWTIIQRRDSGPKEEFLKLWADYEQGFGLVSGNYWIGLKNIYALTSLGSPQELRVDLTDWEGLKAFAKYTNFSISDESDQYRIFVDGYGGDAGDSMTIENGMQFSTIDRDNDGNGGSCAQKYQGAWWFFSCFSAHLNGLYHDMDQVVEYGQGIQWFSWKGYYYSLKGDEMKIRDVI